jgi:hypothetical protein
MLNSKIFLATCINVFFSLPLEKEDNERERERKKKKKKKKSLKYVP